MTGPLVDGRPFAVSRDARLLTEYATGSDTPLTIINRSQSRVWVGTTSSVSANAGVPVDPGTSLAWTSDGQVWAVLDPAGVDGAEIILTTSTATWSPSPAAIGLEVAQASDAIALTWLSATALPAAAGHAQVAVATVPDGPGWLVYKMTIACDSTSQTLFAVYADSVDPANMRDCTALGNRNSNDLTHPLQFNAGETIIARWDNAANDSIATINLAYREGIPA